MSFHYLSRYAAALLPLVLGSAVTAAEPVKAVQGSLFQPADFTSLGKLTVEKDQILIIDTGSSTAAPTISGKVNGNGALGISASGKVQLAVFAFDEIQLSQGAKVTILGDRGLVLVAKGPIRVMTTLSVNGANGTRMERTPVGDIAKGGPGSDGGERGKSVNSAPPPANGGGGGPAMKDGGRGGFGFGAGHNTRCQGGSPGGGGAYGGIGGGGSEGSLPRGDNKVKPMSMPGGAVYGDPALADLFGGSGGAGGCNDRQSFSGSGGGGGGSIALISLEVIDIGKHIGRIEAKGGAGGAWEVGGGGGSGGGVILAAPKVNWPGTIDASGGAGGNGGIGISQQIASGITRRDSGSGGGGGGGRIAIYSKEDLGKPGQNQVEMIIPLRTLNVDGGNGGYRAYVGDAGTIYDGAWPGLR